MTFAPFAALPPPDDGPDQVCVRLPDDLARILDRIAAERRVTRPEVMREALRCLDAALAEQAPQQASAAG